MIQVDIHQLDDAVQALIGALEQGRELAAQSGAGVSRAVAELRADLASSVARGELAPATAERLEGRIEALAATADPAHASAQQIGAAIDLVVTQFRGLASRLETAVQGRELGLHVIRAQEEERRRLAREIHDGPAQLLNSVVLRINVCQKLFDTDLERLREELNQLKELVRLSLQDVRKIIFDLRPMALDDLGLAPALRAFLKDYQARTGIETDFAVFGNERRYDSAFEVAVFRLVQEALTNVYKHAGATRVWVKVETAGGRELRLSVRDDGVGFDTMKVMEAGRGTKFGLVGMRERAELLGGALEIQSAPGQGARLHVTFPLTE